MARGIFPTAPKFLAPMAKENRVKSASRISARPSHSFWNIGARSPCARSRRMLSTNSLLSDEARSLAAALSQVRLRFATGGQRTHSFGRTLRRDTLRRFRAIRRLRIFLPSGFVAGCLFLTRQVRSEYETGPWRNRRRAVRNRSDRADSAQARLSNPQIVDPLQRRPAQPADDRRAISTHQRVCHLRVTLRTIKLSFLFRLSIGHYC
jgi:hypothetical protein